MGNAKYIGIKSNKLVGAILFDITYFFLRFLSHSLSLITF